MPYHLNVDLHHRRLDIALRGFWSDAIVDRYSAAFVGALRCLRDNGGCDVALIDGTQFAIQSQHILARINNLLTDLAPICARRNAVIIPAELNRMQAVKAGERINIRTFKERADAEAWLSCRDAA